MDVSEALNAISSTNTDGVAALPAFAALDVRAVIEQERRGASIQVDESYFYGQELAIDAVGTAAIPSDRRDIVSQSRRFYDQIQVDFDSLTRRNLISVSTRFRQLLQRLPEVRYLKQNFLGTCFVVPEWLRTGGMVKYGARIYFFRKDAAPAPTDIIHRNIEAVVANDRADFERYQGHQHGYPECCIEYFSTRERTAETAPELEAVEPIEKYIDDDVTAERHARSASIGDIADGIFETPRAYAFLRVSFIPNRAVNGLSYGSL
ncbi:hypothetical protein [Natronomonas marina]|jgi:hypothetical protein|uniref:hypothetical protein n=1 Tax=Natronomonas marina TaxID=2961939 RepID=UPI0020C98D3F|nr:hypothetical protein [Natronomonas marina]